MLNRIDKLFKVLLAAQFVLIASLAAAGGPANNVSQETVDTANAAGQF